MAECKRITTKMNNVCLADMWKEIKWMRAYAGKYWFVILFYSISGIIGTVMGLVGSLFTKFLIDTVTGYKTGQIGWIAVIMICMGTGNLMINSLTSRISALFSTKVQNEMQSDVFHKILEADMESLNEFRSGDLLNRLNADVGTVAGCVTGWIPSFLTKGVQFVGALGMILYYDPMMALIAFICAPVSLFMSKAFMKKMRRCHQELKQASSEMMAFENDVFQNVPSIKAFGIVEDFQEKMKENLKSYKKLLLNYNKISVMATALMSFTGMIVSYACLGWSVYRLWTGVIAFGTMTLFLQLASSLNNSFSALVNLVPQAIGAATSAGRIMLFEGLPKERAVYIENEKEIFQNACEKGVSIAMDGLGFAYRGGERILKDVSFHAGPGNIVALVGPSGEGKTTLIRILLGLLNPTEGRAVVKLDDEREYGLSSVTRKLFSYVPQGNTIFAGTIEENLKMVKPDATEEQMRVALEAAEALEFVNKMPKGIKSEIKERGRRLSEGQGQRIAIARALLKDAPVLLFDEATSALDVETEERVLRNILKNGRKKTCIITTHRPSVLKMCTDVYQINDTGLIKIEKIGITDFVKGAEENDSATAAQVFISEGCNEKNTD